MYFPARWGVFECILERAEAMEHEILSFSMHFSARWGVFGCMLGFEEAMKDDLIF